MLDTDWLKMAIYVFAFTFLVLLGERKHPVFLIFAGVIGLVFAFDLYTLLASLTISGIIAGVSVSIFVLGLVKHPKSVVE